jgi:hypothetical protein
VSNNLEEYSNDFANKEELEGYGDNANGNNFDSIA